LVKRSAREPGVTRRDELRGRRAPQRSRRRGLSWHSPPPPRRAAVRRHRADDTVAKAIRAILRAELIVVDDIGLLPVAPDAAEDLYRLVDAAYEKRSVAISSNLHPGSMT